MKYPIILNLFLLISCFVFSQEQVIKITKISTGKEIIIKENKRIKIKTQDGRKLTGRFSIEGNSIRIDNELLELDAIAELKRNPLLTSILSSTFLIYAGSLAIGFGALIGVLVDSTAYWLILPGAGMVFAGAKSPNFNRKFKNDGSWSFEIINLSD
ncbi:hypothetical protein [Winogradskyella alexanderae]|uniref:Uncharacterized protein n=1 Tax=Winogradskyella alexanderae TaxID=2877123 RepID=A0ABS7XQ54_9FLAO|nr:hypothetical protein [Winogradskyella alexanderae]MCA0132136.1 hypothetical protein [Winogradskyella alexanderae]